MKNKIVFLITLVLIMGCTPAPAVAPLDENAIYTFAAQTVQAQLSQTANANSTSTATMTPSQYPSSTPVSYSPEIETLLDGQCNPPWNEEGSFNKNLDLIVADWYFKNHNCKLPIFSHDKDYLAYATLGQRNKEDKNDLWVDTVRIIDLGSQTSQTIHFAHEMDLIANIEWSPTGHLIVSESIWESVFAIFVYDIEKNVLVSKMFLDRDKKLEWNDTKTAFYASSNGGGRGIYSCIQQLGGYDFKNGYSFPDFYELLDVEKGGFSAFGIEFGKDKDLYIKPYGWSTDGNSLWLTITTLSPTDDGWYYEIGPQKAAILSLTSEGPKLTVLEDDPNFNYSFGDITKNEIFSEPYSIELCPTIE